MLLKSFIKLNIQSNNEFILKLQEKIVNKLDLGHIDKQELVNFLYFSAKLSFQPDKEIVIKLQEEALKQLNSFTGQELTNYIFSIIKLNFYPGQELVTKWEKEAVNYHFNSKELVSIDF